MRLELLLAVVCLAPWSPQTPATQDPTPKPFPLSDTAVAIGQDELIEGAWQLQTIDSLSFPVFPGELLGYAIFHGGYMSIEIHGVSQMHMALSEGRFFQTGFYRYIFDGMGGMETSSMIGMSNLSEDAEAFSVTPGERGKYKVTLTVDRLILERADGTRHTFTKLGKLPFPGVVEQVDAFGRPVKSSTDVTTPPGAKKE